MYHLKLKLWPNAWKLEHTKPLKQAYTGIWYARHRILYYLNDLRVRIILQRSDRNQPQQWRARLSSLVHSYRSPHYKSKVEKTQILCWISPLTRYHLSMAVARDDWDNSSLLTLFPAQYISNWSVPGRNVNGEKCDSSLRNGQLERGSTPSQTAAPHLIWGRRRAERPQIVVKARYSAYIYLCVFNPIGAAQMTFNCICAALRNSLLTPASQKTRATFFFSQAAIDSEDRRPCCISLENAGDDWGTLFCEARLVWMAQAAHWKADGCRYGNDLWSCPPPHRTVYPWCSTHVHHGWPGLSVLTGSSFFFFLFFGNICK